MQLPFTEAQFLDVFARYNNDFVIGAAVLWLASLIVAVLWLFRKVPDKPVVFLLAGHWLWAGIAYHLVEFTSINPAAKIFGIAFIVEALLLLWYGNHRRDLHFGVHPQLWTAVGAVLVLYSLAYPLLIIAVGFRYPRMPTFGVPCPTALFASGLLIAASPRPPRVLFVIPLLWCILGGTAAFLLGVAPDWMLLLCALAIAWRMAAVDVKVAPTDQPVSRFIP